MPPDVGLKPSSGFSWVIGGDGVRVRHDVILFNEVDFVSGLSVATVEVSDFRMR